MGESIKSNFLLLLLIVGIWGVAGWGNLGIAFPSTRPMGDVNGDGTTDRKDLQRVLRAVAGLVHLTPEQMVLADVAPKPGIGNRLIGDGLVTLEDARRLLLYIHGRISLQALGPEPVVETCAGSGPSGFTAGGWVDGPAHQARFFSPFDVALDPRGNLYVADWFHSLIRKITPQGEVITLAGRPGSRKGVGGFADGPGDQAWFNHPESLTFGPDGFLYVADSANHRIRRVNPDTGEVITYAGTGRRGLVDGPRQEAEFNWPAYIRSDKEGNLYIADKLNHAIRKITSEGIVLTLAGNGRRGFRDGPGSVAQFNEPKGVDVDDQWVYVADGSNHAVRRVSKREGNTFTLFVSDLPGTEGFFENPMGIAVTPEGILFLADWVHQTILVWQKSSRVQLLAGKLDEYGYRDGPASMARFFSPMGLVYDPQRSALYVADTENQRIRVLRFKEIPALPYCRREEE